MSKFQHNFHYLNNFNLFIALSAQFRHSLVLPVIKKAIFDFKNAKMQLISVFFDPRACPAPKLSLFLDLPGPGTSHPFFAQTPGVPGGGDGARTIRMTHYFRGPTPKFEIIIMIL